MPELELLITPLKIGIYILLFIPGFIFVQIKDHHLLREKVPQFEKSFEIILWSAIIWFIAYIIPYLPFAEESRKNVMGVIDLIAKKDPNVGNEILSLKSDLGFIFISVSFWSFVFSNAYSIIRKTKRINAIIKWFTGRDWYPSLSFKFFQDNVGQMIEVKIGDNDYVGILNSVPQRNEDKSIIIEKPWIIIQNKKEKRLEELSDINYIIIKTEDIKEIKAYNEDVLKSV